MPPAAHQIERRLFHPLVEQWLQSRRYRYDHEPMMAKLYPDFVVYPDDNTVLFIECKTSIMSAESAQVAIGQVTRYRHLCVADLSKRPKYIRAAIAAEFNFEGMSAVRSVGIEVIHIPFRLINWDIWHRRRSDQQAS